MDIKGQKREYRKTEVRRKIGKKMAKKLQLANGNP